MTAATPSSLDAETKNSRWRLPVAIVSLMATPLLVFISSANTLFLRNQTEFQHQLQVVNPFLQLSLITLLTGLAIYALSKYQPFRLLLYAYYLVGPFFLLFGFLHNWAVSSHFFLWGLRHLGGSARVLCLLCRGHGLRFQTREPIGPVRPVRSVRLAFVGYRGTLLRDAVREAGARDCGLANSELETPARICRTCTTSFSTATTPEHFPQTLSPYYRHALSGFVNFPENVAPLPQHTHVPTLHLFGKA